MYKFLVGNRWLCAGAILNFRKSIRSIRNLLFRKTVSLAYAREISPREDEEPLEIPDEIRVLCKGDSVPPLGPTFDDRRVALQRMLEEDRVVMLHQSEGRFTAILMSSITDYYEASVGCYMRIAPDEVYQFGWHVDPELRKKGGAIRLVNFSATYFRAMGKRRLVCEIFRNNTVSRRVVSFLGYQEVGEEIRRYRILGFLIESRRQYQPPPPKRRRAKKSAS